MENLAGYIEHTILAPEATVDDITRGCNEVIKYGFRGICVNSGYVGLCAHLLAGSGAKVIATCAFPLGAVRPEVKAFEARTAAENKADEIDMVMNIGAAKSGNWEAVAEDIRMVVEAAKVPVKVIIETDLLTDAEKKLACRAAVEAGASYVKTSTSGLHGGAKLEDIKLMKQAVAGRAKIKASGGIRTREQAINLVKAGADSLGTSTGPFILAVQK